MNGTKRFDNRLGVMGWLGGGRWGMERYLFIAHRATGLLILSFFLIHVFASSSRIFGPESWNMAIDFLKRPLFLKIGEFCLFCCFAFHGLNGLRLILIELGVAVGRAEEPVYPYRTSLNVQRPIMIVVMVMAAAVMLAGGMGFFVLQ